MAVKVDLSGLNNFRKKVENINTQTIINKILVALCESGKQKANELYTGYDVDIDYEVSGNRASILANGEYVAFLEYGTGEYAKGTYKGNLPQSGVPITGNWEYYYDSDSKAEVNGQKGWWFGGSFQIGNEAQAQMWNIRNYLKENARTIIKNVLGANK